MASLHDAVEAVVVRLGLELDEITQAKAGSRVLVRIILDGDGSDGRGLNLDEVAAASKKISEALDESNVMGDRPYVLEVGTRGVEAPLTKPSHWRRNSGRLVKVSQSDGEPFTARILSVHDDGVELEGCEFLPFTQVKKAIVQVEMNRGDEE